jgi:hypothetical protein
MARQGATWPGLMRLFDSNIIIYATKPGFDFLQVKLGSSQRMQIEAKAD